MAGGNQGLYESGEIDSAIRAIRAYLEVNDPEALVFLAKDGEHTEQITAGNGHLGELHQLEMVVAHLEELANRQEYDAEEVARTEIETTAEAQNQPIEKRH